MRTNRTRQLIAAISTLTMTLTLGLAISACSKADNPEVKPDTDKQPKANTGGVIPKGDPEKGIGTDPQKLYKDFCTNDPAASIQKGLTRLFMRFTRDGNTVIVDACGKGNTGTPSIAQADFVNVGNYRDGFVKSTTCRDSGSSSCYYRIPDQGRNDDASIRYVKWSDFGKIPPSYTDGDSWKKAPDETWMVIGQLVDELPGSRAIARHEPKPAVTNVVYVAPPPSATVVPDGGPYVLKADYDADKAKQAARDDGQDKAIEANKGNIATLQSAFDEWQLHHKMAAGK